MNVFGPWLISLGDANFFEIVHVHFDISADNLHVYHYFLVLCAGQSVSVFLLRLQSIRKWLILGKLKLSILGLDV